jgi:predicted dehydrogenase
MYRIGIIGTGRIAGSIQDEIESGPFTFLLPYSHAGAYEANPRTSIVAAADVNDDRLAAFAARWTVPATYTDFRDMLANEQLDIVSVCTPTRIRADVVEALAGSGVKGVFMEKPISQSLREADVMIAAFNGSKIKTVVNHVRTFDPYYRRIRWLIEQGTIGDLHSIFARWKEGLSFGGSHLFDLLRYLVGAEVSWVFGRLDDGDGYFDPGGNGIISFANGVDALLDNTVGHAGPKELDIAGSMGRIRAGDTISPELYELDDRSPFGELLQRPFPGSVIAKSPMSVALEELIRSIETGERTGSELLDGRKNLEIAVAFHLSHRANAPVTLPVLDLDYTIVDPWGRSN